MTALADLVHRFAVLLDPADGSATLLSTWITSVQAEDLPHLHAFTRGLEKRKRRALAPAGDTTGWCSAGDICGELFVPFMPRSRTPGNHDGGCRVNLEVS